METIYAWISIVLFIFIGIYFVKSKKINRKPPFTVLVLLLLVGTFVQYIGINYISTQPWQLNIMHAFFNALKMITADFRHEVLQHLMRENVFYYFAVLLAHILVLFYTVYFFVSIISFKTINSLRVHYGRLKEQYVIMGDLDNVTAFMESIKIKTRIIVLVDQRKGKSEEEIVEHYNQLNDKCVIAYMFKELNKKLITNLSIYRRHDKAIRYISLFNDDAKNTMFTQILSKVINAPNNKFYKHVHGYALNANYLQAEHMQSVLKSEGNVRVFNKQDLIGKTFLSKYPLTQLVPKSFITNRGSLKKETYNYHFVGFGRLNQDLIKKIMINNQFLDTEINYYVYSRNLNDNVGEFLKPLRIYHSNHEDTKCLKPIHDYYNADAYYAPPKDIGNINFDSVDVRQLNFLKKLKTRITINDDVNIIIVSLGSELINAQITREIRAYLNDENISKNAHLFMKINSLEYFDELVSNQAKIIPFGMLNETLTFERIIDQVSEKFAIAMHHDYLTKPKAWEKKWYSSPHIQKSNLYVAMHLRTKLHLMGLDFSHEKPNYDWKAHYYKVYNPNGVKPLQTEKKTSIDDLKQYYLNHDKESFRQILAKIEKQRWNAFHFLNGWVPMKKREFQEKLNQEPLISNPSKNDQHQHICLTSFEGLLDIVKTMIDAKRSIEDADYLQYDYVMMDNLPQHIEAFNNNLSNKASNKIYIIKRV